MCVASTSNAYFLARFLCSLFNTLSIIRFTLQAKLFNCYSPQEAEARGEDFERVKFLDTPAEDAEKIGRKKKKANPDTGFAGWVNSVVVANIVVVVYTHVMRWCECICAVIVVSLM